MAELETVFIIKPLKCPDSVDLVASLSTTATGYPLNLAKLSAQGAAARKVLRAIDKAASVTDCPAGCTKELSEIKHQRVSFDCKRIWWTLWTNHRCTCTVTVTKTLECIPKPETETQTEPQVAELEEFQEPGFLQEFIGLFARFVFPLIFLCIFFFLVRLTFFAVISPVPTIDATSTPIPTLTPTPPLVPTATTMLISEPTETPAGAIAPATPVTGEPTLTFNTNINVREGPGVEYEVVWTFEQGETTTIIGRYDNTSWILVRIDDSITRKQCGWVSADLLGIDVSNLPVLNTMPDVYDCPQ